MFLRRMLSSVHGFPVSAAEPERLDDLIDAPDVIDTGITRPSISGICIYDGLRRTIDLGKPSIRGLEASKKPRVKRIGNQRLNTHTRTKDIIQTLFDRGWRYRYSHHLRASRTSPPRPISLLTARRSHIGNLPTSS